MSVLERHVDKWTPEPNTGCYLWIGGFSTGRSDRPSAGWNGKIVAVARVVCEEVNGQPPSSKHHAAHNTPNGCVGTNCVNGGHLRWATAKENQQDVPPDVRSDRIRRGAAVMTPEARMDRHRKMLAKRWPKVSH